MMGSGTRLSEATRESQVLTQLRERPQGVSTGTIATLLGVSYRRAHQILQNMALSGKIDIAREVTPSEKTQGLSNIYKIAASPLQKSAVPSEPKKISNVNEQRAPAVAAAPTSSPRVIDGVDLATLRVARQAFDTPSVRFLLGRAPTDQEVVAGLLRAGLEKLSQK